MPPGTAAHRNMVTWPAQVVPGEDAVEEFSDMEDADDDADDEDEDEEAAPTRPTRGPKGQSTASACILKE